MGHFPITQFPKHLQGTPTLVSPCVTYPFLTFQGELKEMAFNWLFSLFQRDRRAGHEAVFDVDQGVIAENRLANALEDLAQVSKRKLETLRQLEKDAQGFKEQ